MSPYLSRQLPVITPSIEFFPKNLGPPPIITTQINFSPNTPSQHAQLEEDDTDMMEITDMIDTPVLEETPDNNVEDFLNNLDFVLCNTKIPKPSGEPGRPRSGGYSLEAALEKWGEELFQAVNRFIKLKVDEDLDTAQSFSKQDKADIDAICNLAEKKFPILHKYEGCWPARDIVKLHLKYTSEVHRKEVTTKRRVRQRIST